MPVAAEYMESLFESKNLIAPIPRVNRMLVEAHQIRHFFTTFILQSYRGELDLDQIDEILRESVSNPAMFNQDFMRLIFHTFAVYFIKLENIQDRNGV